MENTLENKARFFAQYWGQNILTQGFSKPHTIKGSIMEIIYKEDYLELIPLSLISIQDSDKIAEIENDFEEKKYRGQILSQRIDEDFSGKYPVIDFSISVATEISDYLRSKGYALPWMGLSVDKLQEYGWIKLKSE